MQMTSEGMRRLGILLGALASVAWIIYIAVLSNGFTDVKPLGWLIFSLAFLYHSVSCSS
jgi:uncharacterized membrane protein required for colicin V production